MAATPSATLATALQFKALMHSYQRKNLVLLEGIELSTSPLPRECSTTELQQRIRPRAMG